MKRNPKVVYAIQHELNMVRDGRQRHEAARLSKGAALAEPFALHEAYTWDDLFVDDDRVIAEWQAALDEYEAGTEAQS